VVALKEMTMIVGMWRTSPHDRELTLLPDEVELARLENLANALRRPEA
jgi:hypothetical protein